MSLPSVGRTSANVCSTDIEVSDRVYPLGTKVLTIAIAEMLRNANGVQLNYIGYSISLLVPNTTRRYSLDDVDFS